MNDSNICECRQYSCTTCLADIFPVYFNGTPAASVSNTVRVIVRCNTDIVFVQVLFGLDILVPMHFGNKTVDLLVAGPNEGQNNGPFLYTISGTIGATYAGIERGVSVPFCDCRSRWCFLTSALKIPGIAISAGNGTHRSFTTNTGLPDDPANTVARLTANFVAALANTTNTTTDRILPLSVGLGYVYLSH